MQTKNRFRNYLLASTVISTGVIYINHIISENIEKLFQNQAPILLNIDTLKNSPETISVIIVKPDNLLASAGILATLYVATALTSRVQLSSRDEETKKFIGEGINTLASILAVYSLTCMAFYFFQEQKDDLKAGEFLFYLTPAYIFYLISAYLPLDIRTLTKRREVNKQKIGPLLEKVKKLDFNIIRSSYFFNFIQALEGGIRQVFKVHQKFARSHWWIYILLTLTTSPLLATILAISISQYFINPEFNPPEESSNFLWETALLFTFAHTLQLICLSEVHKTTALRLHSKVIGSGKGKNFTRVTILSQTIIFLHNLASSAVVIYILTQELIDTNKTVLAIIVFIQVAATFTNPILLIIIYKRYYKHLSEGPVGESYKAAILYKALNDAKEKDVILNQRIQDLQEPMNY